MSPMKNSAPPHHKERKTGATVDIFCVCLSVPVGICLPCWIEPQQGHPRDQKVQPARLSSLVFCSPPERSQPVCCLAPSTLAKIAGDRFTPQLSTGSPFALTIAACSLSEHVRPVSTIALNFQPFIFSELAACLRCCSSLAIRSALCAQGVRSLRTCKPFALRRILFALCWVCFGSPVHVGEVRLLLGLLVGAPRYLL